MDPAFDPHISSHLKDLRAANPSQCPACFLTLPNNQLLETHVRWTRVLKCCHSFYFWFSQVSSPGGACVSLPEPSMWWGVWETAPTASPPPIETPRLLENENDQRVDCSPWENEQKYVQCWKWTEICTMLSLALKCMICNTEFASASRNQIKNHRHQTEKKRVFGFGLEVYDLQHWICLRLQRTN